MFTASIQDTAHFALSQGYTILFLLMFLEGPAVTAAGAFAAAIGYFHLWIVFVLSIFANLIPDAVYYAIGYYGRETVLTKYGHYFGLTPERIKRAEDLANRHSGKSLIAIKLIPFLATPGLIVVGASKMNIKQYAWWSILITIPSSLAYLILGYYFGAAYTSIQRYLHIGGYVVGAAVVVIGVLIYFQRKYAEKIFDKW